MSEVVVRVLGPVEIASGGDTIQLPGRNLRRLLSTLVISINRAVPVDVLVEAMWGATPPDSALSIVQTYISRLRRALGTNRVVSQDHSYALVLNPDAVDVVRFERLARRAEEAVGDEPQRALELADEALGLWRGTPFGNLADEAFFHLEAERLENIRLAVVEIGIEAQLALGRHRHVIGLLETAVEEHPYRERLWFMLMTALARDGRRVEALRAYRQLAAILAATGLEPTEAIRELEEQILREDDDLRASFGPAGRSGPSPPHPRADPRAPHRVDTAGSSSDEHPYQEPDYAVR